MTKSKNPKKKPTPSTGDQETKPSPPQEDIDVEEEGSAQTILAKPQALRDLAQALRSSLTGKPAKPKASDKKDN